MISITDVLSSSNLRSAHAKVVKNKGSAGIDNMSVDELSSYLKQHWASISESIKKGTYRPQPVRRVEIPKEPSGKRLLGIPTVLDRMVQQSIGQQLSMHYDARFSEHSYGFRPGRSCHDAVDRALDYLHGGYEYMVEIDLSKFFDRVNHDRLMYRLSLEIRDKMLLRLLRRYLQSGVMIDGVIHETREGTPQGGNLSPVLSNIVLDELDKELEKRGHKFVRYADDIRIFVKSQRAGERVLSSTADFIEGRLKLRVNRDKSGVYHYTKGGMLGFGFFFEDGDGKVECRVLDESYRRFRRKLKRLTSRRWSISFDERMMYLRDVINGWVAYYGKAKCASKMKETDGWVRRRLRMCIWKQWKIASKRIRSLIQLGIPVYQAYRWGYTRKGYWRVSVSPILATSITNARLEIRGYTSILKVYRRRHSILMNRRDTRTVRPVV